MAKSFATTVATPSKCPGRDAPSQRVTDAADRHRRRRRGGPRRVHLAHRRHEDDVDTGLRTDEQVALERPRVALDVLGVAELQRVHEDADRHDVALGPGPRHERAVAVVQRAHGRHQPDHPTRRTGLVEQGPAPGGGLDDVHRAGRPRPPPARPGRRGGRGRHPAGRRPGPAAWPAPPRPGSRRARLRAAHRGGGSASPSRPGGPGRSARRRRPSAATSSTAARVRGRNDSRSSPTVTATRSTWPRRATTWFAAMQAAAW